MKLIHKAVLKTNFTTLPNKLLRDSTLSLRARGLLAMMLSHTEEWRSTMAHMRGLVTEGRDALRTAWLELEKSGYCKRLPAQRNKDHSFSGQPWMWYDTPLPIGERTASPIKPLPEKPSSGNPSTGKGSDRRKTNQRKKPIGKRVVCKGVSSEGGIFLGTIPTLNPEPDDEPFP